MEEPKKKAPTPSGARAHWYGPAVVVVILGALAAYMTLQRAGVIANPPVLPADSTRLPTPAQESKYTEGTEIPTGLQQPRAIAVGPDERLYMAGDRKLRIFLAGKSDEEYPLPAIPHCLTVARDGTIYVGFRDYVGVYDRSGRLQAKWEPLGLRAFLTAIATDGHNVWVADAGNRAALRYNPRGEILARLGGKGAGGRMPALVVPSPYLGLALSRDGMVLIANPGEHTVNLVTVEGVFRGAWGQAGSAVEDFAGCCNPTHLAALPDRRVVTAEKGTPRVKVYTPEGKLDAVVAGPEAFQPDTKGLSLATDKQERIFVLDPTRRTVRVFAPKQESSE